MGAVSRALIASYGKRVVAQVFEELPARVSLQNAISFVGPRAGLLHRKWSAHTTEFGKFGERCVHRASIMVSRSNDDW